LDELDIFTRTFVLFCSQKISGHIFNTLTIPTGHTNPMVFYYLCRRIRYMSKNKLSKFADMATYPHVFQTTDFETPDKPHEMKGRWKELFFHNDNPITLELGCGRGEYTVGLARMFPERNFIGIDIKGSRMWTGATEALNEGLKNVAFLRTRIEFITRFFDTDEVDEIWLTFCDPQMKKPTKRLSSTYFLERYRKFLRNNGLIHLKTDSNFLFTYTLYMMETNHLTPTFFTRDLYKDAPTMSLSDNQLKLLQIKTYYEEQWILRGIPIKYLSFALPHEGQLVEPDIEIELDTYRSYSRDKRSALTKAK